MRIGSRVGMGLVPLAAAAPARQPVRGMVLLRLQDGAPIAAGRDTSGAGLLAMAGAVNAFDGFSGWKPISLEAAAAAAPELIVLPESTLAAAGGIEGLRTVDAARTLAAFIEGGEERG